MPPRHSTNLHAGSPASHGNQLLCRLGHIHGTNDPICNLATRQLWPTTCKKRQNLAPMAEAIAAWPQLVKDSQSFLGSESEALLPMPFLQGQALILFANDQLTSLSASLRLLR